MIDTKDIPVQTPAARYGATNVLELIQAIGSEQLGKPIPAFPAEKDMWIRDLNLRLYAEVEPYWPNLFRLLGYKFALNEAGDSIRLVFDDEYMASCSANAHVAMCAALRALPLELDQ